MSQTPPASGGWIDPYGTVQPGFPPPGYWQASDGRWYPPESRPAEPFVAAEPQGPQPFAAPEEQTVAVGPPPGPGSAPQPGYGAPGAAQPYGAPPGPVAQPQPYGAPGSTGQPYGAPGSIPAYGGPPPYGGPGPVGQPFGGLPGGPPAKTSRTGLWIVLGIVGLLFVGCGAAVAISLAAGDPPISPTTTRSTGTVPTGVTTTQPSSPEDTTDFGGLFGSTEDGLSDIASCTRIDADRIVIDLTNRSSSTASYFLNVVLEDTPGQRLADTSAYIEDLRAGEHAVEEVYIFEDQGSTCQVIGADRVASTSDPAFLSDIGACTVGEPDILEDVVASLSATNPTSANADYSIVVAVIDSGGVRRGSGYAFIETVRPGETAPGEVFTTVKHEDGYTCEIVGVDRSPS